MLPSSTTSILLHRDNGLLAVICDDLVVRIVDIETRRIVRELKGFRGRILDVVRGSILVQTLPAYRRNRIDFFPRLPLVGRSVPRLHHPYIRHPHRAVN